MSGKNVKAIILAAGKGTRMKSSLPKVLHKIFDKTLLDYVLQSVSAIKNLDELFVIVGHQAEEVEAHVKANYSNAKCILQSPQRGTGDAVNKAFPYLKNYDGLVLVTCGDTPLLTEQTLSKLVEYHTNTKADLTVMSAVFNDPTNYGRIVRDTKFNLKAIVEQKDATEEIKAIKEINAGVYCIDWQKISPAFESLTCNNANGEYYLTDIVEWAVRKGLNTQAYVIDDNTEIFGINSKQNLAQATKILTDKIINKHLENGITIVDPSSVYISPDTEIGEDTIIYPNVYINGKNKIGSNCKIGPFAHLRGDVVVGNNSKIGNFVEIKKSTIANNTNVCHLSYIGDSELGANVNIGAGTITANYDHLTKVKSRTIVGDNVAVGSNSVLVAPVEIESSATIGAGTIVTKDIPANALAVTRSPLKIFSNWVQEKLSLCKK